MSTPLRIFLVDDEAPARERLRTLLEDIAEDIAHVVVGEAADGAAALAALEQVSAEVVLVDVRMPRMDGLEFAQHAAALATPPAIIFTTAFDHYAVQAFEVSAVDYLLKPIRAQRLLQALQKVARRGAEPGISRVGSAAPPTATLNPEARRYLSCHERGKLLLIPVADILYLRADTKYVMARTAEREFLLNDSLLTLESEFGERFLRLHRSVLAAKAALIGFEKAHDADGEHWVALLKGIPDRLPVSRRHWPVVKEFARQLSGA